MKIIHVSNYLMCPKRYLINECQCHCRYNKFKDRFVQIRSPIEISEIFSRETNNNDID